MPEGERWYIELGPLLLALLPETRSKPADRLQRCFELLRLRVAVVEAHVVPEASVR